MSEKLTRPRAAPVTVRRSCWREPQAKPNKLELHIVTLFPTTVSIANEGVKTWPGCFLLLFRLVPSGYSKRVTHGFRCANNFQRLQWCWPSDLQIVLGTSMQNNSGILRQPLRLNLTMARYTGLKKKSCAQRPHIRRSKPFKTYAVPPVTIVFCLLSLATLGKMMGDSSDMACDAFLFLIWRPVVLVGIAPTPTHYHWPSPTLEGTIRDTCHAVCFCCWTTSSKLVNQHDLASDSLKLSKDTKISRPWSCSNISLGAWSGAVYE